MIRSVDAILTATLMLAVAGCGAFKSESDIAGSEAMADAVAEESEYPIYLRLRFQAFSENSSVIEAEVGKECEIEFRAAGEKNFVLTIIKDGNPIRTIRRTPKTIADDQGREYKIFAFLNLDPSEELDAFDWPIYVVGSFVYPMSSLVHRDQFKNLFAPFEAETKTQTRGGVTNTTITFSDPYSDMVHNRLYFDSSQSKRPVKHESMFGGKVASSVTYSEFVSLPDERTLPGILELLDGRGAKTYTLTLISHEDK